MNWGHEFNRLGRQQLAVDDGLRMLRQIRAELLRHGASAQAWGDVAILANVTLIPLNIIVNAFELGAAQSTYQHLVRALYNKFSSSGTRSDRHISTLLGATKEAVVKTLKSKGLTQYVPGANILLGLSQDAWAAWQVVTQVEDGRGERAKLVANLDRSIQRAEQQLMQLGIRRAQALDRVLVHNRTA